MFYFIGMAAGIVGLLILVDYLSVFKSAERNLYTLGLIFLIVGFFSTHIWIEQKDEKSLLKLIPLVEVPIQGGKIFSATAHVKYVDGKFKKIWLISGTAKTLTYTVKVP